MTARPYKSNLVGVTAGFPASVYSPIDARDNDLDAGSTYDRTDTGTVPASSPYRIVLDLAPLSNFPSTSVTVNGSSRSITEIGSVTTGTVGIDFTSGLVEFASADAGTAYSITYRGRGTALDATLFNQLQKELAATQTELLKCEHLIGEVTGVNLKTSATTNLAAALTTATILTRIEIIPTTVSGLTVNPICTAGTNAGGAADYLMPSTELIGLSTTRPFIWAPVGGVSVICGVGERPTFTVGTGATATTLTATIRVYGRNA